MKSARLCFCLLLLGVQTAIPEQKGETGCAEPEDIRILSGDSDSGNDIIQGKIEICEEVWKSLCDDQWTVEDATVACRDLGYSDLDATTYHPNVVEPVYSSKRYACNGSEAKLAECRAVNSTGDCTTVGVQCYSANFTVTHSTTSTMPTNVNLQPSSTLTYPPSTVHHVTQSPVIQATVPTKNSSPSLPVYIYAIIGTIAILTVTIFIVVVLIICRSARRTTRRKRVISPQSQKKGCIPPEEALYCGLNESQSIKETYTIAQHHVYHEVAPSSGPIYDDIKPTKDENLKDSDTPKVEPYVSGGNRQNAAMYQQDPCSHKKPPPIKEKTCTPYAVNPLAFQKSPTEREFDRISNDYTTTASSLGEQIGDHYYAVLEGPTEHHPTHSALHNSCPIEGELVGGHHYAILERHNTEP